MKKTLIIILMSVVALLTAPSCISQGKVFKEAASLPGVTSVYIGTAMMRLAGGAASVSEYGEYAKYISDIKSIEVLSCEDASQIKAVSDICNRILAEMHYEVLLEADEGNEHTVIYGGVADTENPDIIDDMVIVSQEASEYDVVFIRGKINVAQMMQDNAADKDK